MNASLRPAGDDRTKRSVGADVEMHTDRAFIRRLQEGKFKTAVTVEHPYLIPPPITLPEQLLEFTRGSMAELPVVFDRLGGMVEVRGTGKAGRLTPEQGDPMIRAVADGKVDFPGTIPGVYRVETCDDSGCLNVAATWMHVAVLAGKTTFLP